MFLAKWARSKSEDGKYHFGDLFLKKLVNKLIADEEDHENGEDYDNDDFYDDDENNTSFGIKSLSNPEEHVEPTTSTAKSSSDHLNSSLSPVESIFFDTVSLILSGGEITKEQLEMLWEASEELTAEQSARVFTAVIKSLSNPESINATTDSSEEAIALNVRRLSTAVDIILKGKSLSPAQYQSIKSISSVLPAKEILVVLKERFIIHWAKRQEAIREYKTVFSSAVTFTLNQRQAGCNVDNCFMTLLGYSAYLPQKEVLQVLSELNTSWEELSSQSTKKFVSFANQRPVEQQGVRPPKPPPPAGPRPIKQTEITSTVSNPPGAVTEPVKNRMDNSLLAAIQNKSLRLKKVGEDSKKPDPAVAIQSDLSSALHKMMLKRRKSISFNLDNDDDDDHDKEFED